MINRRDFLCFAGAAAAMLFLDRIFPSALVFAADPADLPVTISKKDGTTVRGKITAYDKDKVTIDAIGKPKDPTVSTDVPWDQIKRVSNGLTHDKALQKWKADHVDSLCLTCHGNCTIFCPTCHGTSHDPAANTNCPACKGAEELACATKRCKEGIIPCTNPKCLKLTDGGWVKEKDGLLWKSFAAGNGGSFKWSEHHVGQVIDRQNGEWANLGPCPVCGGKTTIFDPVCRGTSKMPCPTCSKNNKSPACPAKCDSGVVVCNSCQGSGLKSA